MSSRRGQGYVYRRGNVWWVSYSIRGKKQRESSGGRSHAAAVKLLNKRLADRKPARRDFERLQFAEIVDVIRVHYRVNRLKSAKRLEGAIKHLTAAFSGWLVVDIRAAVIGRYAVDRLDCGAKPATVNRELAALRQMFRLGHDAELVELVPKIVLLKEDNVRTGFVEKPAFQAIRAELPERLHALADVLYVTGWRKSEVLSRQWRHVDLGAGWIRLEPGETKSGKGRQFSFAPIPRLKAALEAQYAQKLETEKQTGSVVRAVFFYPETGQPIKDFRGAWDAACIRAGQPGILVHDMRRTAARNNLRAGISQSIAMKMMGHKTSEIFERYAIVDEVTLTEAAAKLGTYHTDDVAPERKVLAIDQKQSTA